MRPTQGIVRQALFNILGARIVAAHFLDLFAGTGSVGFEALSRGAESVTFVENSRELQSLIGESAAKLGASGRYRLAAAEVVNWLERNRDQVGEFDVAYVDPPYKDPVVHRVVELLAESPPALVVVEHDRRVQISLSDAHGARLSHLRDATYGTTVLTFLARID
jgi:16S rRNA (guanine966-N2)-methyltransferase